MPLHTVTVKKLGLGIAEWVCASHVVVQMGRPRPRKRRCLVQGYIKVRGRSQVSTTSVAFSDQTRACSRPVHLDWQLGRQAGALVTAEVNIDTTVFTL